MPTEQAESNPNISGFIDKSPYTGPGTHLQSQWEGLEVRNEKISNLFSRLQRDIEEWESSIRNEICPSSGIEINKKSALFIKAIANLTNQGLLAAVPNEIHRDISN